MKCYKEIYLQVFGIQVQMESNAQTAALTIDSIIESQSECRRWLVTASDELKHEIKSPTVVTMWHPGGSWRRYFIYSQIISIHTEIILSN